jgi:hypothetical protein
MISETLPISAVRSRRLGRGAFPVLGILLLALLTIGGFSLAAEDMISWDLLSFLFSSTIFVGVLSVSRPLAGAAHVAERKSFLIATLVIWTFLMASDGIFAHLGSTESAAGGHFGSTAYYEAASWILTFLALAFVTGFRPYYLRRIFTGVNKWAAIFAIVAVLSVPLSPGKLYSLTMAFKLCVIVLTLCAIGEAIENDDGVRKLFSALFAGAFLLTFVGFLMPWLGPGPVFSGTRYGVMIGLSGISGILLILCVLFLLVTKNPWFLVMAVFSLVPMMLAGGKGGIVASFLALVMFFALLKKAAQALVACIGFTVVFLLCVAFTPFGTFIQSYSESGNASSLTGRTELWAAVWPEILHRPIFGHGYRASRFLSTEVEGAFAEAGHVHNSFLEVMYNNGVVGLFPILVMNVIIVYNLGKVIRKPPSMIVRYYAAGAFALYIQLLLWGITAPTFGGTPDMRFMTFFAVLLISVFLKQESARQTLARHA